MISQALRPLPRRATIPIAAITTGTTPDNAGRLHSAIGDLPPVEYELQYVAKSSMPHGRVSAWRREAQPADPPGDLPTGQARRDTRHLLPLPHPDSAQTNPTTFEMAMVSRGARLRAISATRSRPDERPPGSARANGLPSESQDDPLARLSTTAP